MAPPRPPSSIADSVRPSTYSIADGDAARRARQSAAASAGDRHATTCRRLDSGSPSARRRADRTIPSVPSEPASTLCESAADPTASMR